MFQNNEDLGVCARQNTARKAADKAAKITTGMAVLSSGRSGEKVSGGQVMAQVDAGLWAVDRRILGTDDGTEVMFRLTLARDDGEHVWRRTRGVLR